MAYIISGSSMQLHAIVVSPWNGRNMCLSIWVVCWHNKIFDIVNIYSENYQFFPLTAATKMTLNNWMILFPAMATYHLVVQTTKLPIESSSHQSCESPLFAIFSPLFSPPSPPLQLIISTCSNNFQFCRLNFMVDDWLMEIVQKSLWNAIKVGRSFSAFRALRSVQFSSVQADDFDFPFRSVFTPTH